MQQVPQQGRQGVSNPSCKQVPHHGMTGRSSKQVHQRGGRICSSHSTADLNSEHGLLALGRRLHERGGLPEGQPRLPPP